MFGDDGEEADVGVWRDEHRLRMNPRPGYNGAKWKMISDEDRCRALHSVDQEVFGQAQGQGNGARHPGGDARHGLVELLHCRAKVFGSDRTDDRDPKLRSPRRRIKKGLIGPRVWIIERMRLLRIGLVGQL
jgi:hypothetical protein